MSNGECVTDDGLILDKSTHRSVIVVANTVRQHILDTDVLFTSSSLNHPSSHDDDDDDDGVIDVH